MLSSRAIRRWSTIHTWTSLICTLFLLLLCLTGLPLIFRDEIDALSGDTIVAATLPHDTPDASLDRVADAALQRHPDRVVRSLFYDDDSPHVVEVGLVASVDAPAETVRIVAVDARTAQVLKEPKPKHGFMHIMLMLHEELFLGLAGTLFIGVMGLLFLLAIVSGVVLYAPFMRRIDFGTVRMRASTRIRWLDVHNLAGIVTMLWLLVVGATGVMNTLSRPLFGLWAMQNLPPLLAPYEGQPRPTHLQPVQGAVDTARTALPAMEVVSVVYPTTQFGSPRHYMIWTRGRTPLTSRLMTPVLVDVQNGKLIMAKGLPWYLRLLELSRPLHFGDYGGLPMKMVWALLDLLTIVVLVSGVWLWAKRRRKATQKPVSRTAAEGVR
jgi:uncharacterized iron-regulated membrane protein